MFEKPELSLIKRLTDKNVVVVLVAWLGVFWAGFIVGFLWSRLGEF